MLAWPGVQPVFPEEFIFIRPKSHHRLLLSATPNLTHSLTPAIEEGYSVIVDDLTTKMFQWELKFDQGFEAEIVVEILKLMFGQNFGTKFWSRFV